MHAIVIFHFISQKSNLINFWIAICGMERIFLVSYKGKKI